MMVRCKNCEKLVPIVREQLNPRRFVYLCPLCRTLFIQVGNR